MSAAELLKKMQKVREERALRAINSSEQAAKVETAKLSETSKQEQQQQQQQERLVFENKQVPMQSERKGEISSHEPHTQKEKNNLETMSVKKDEEHDLMLNVPPSFTSPAHAVPQYRNRTSDPLCAPFHANLAANMFLHELICQNVDAAYLQSIDSVKHNEESDIDVHQTKPVSQNETGINNGAPFSLEAINRKRARPSEQEENDKVEERTECTNGKSICSNQECKIDLFDQNVLDSVRLLNTCLVESELSSSVVAKYFSAYLAHKLNVVHHVTSPLDQLQSKELLQQSQHKESHSFIDNNIINNNSNKRKNYDLYDYHHHRYYNPNELHILKQQEEPVLHERTDADTIRLPINSQEHLELTHNSNLHNDQTQTRVREVEQEEEERKAEPFESDALRNKNEQSSSNNSNNNNNKCELPWKALYDDSDYIRECQRASIHTHNLHTCPCADVNQYVRKDFIAHGVYGVVFSASKQIPVVKTKESHSFVLRQKASKSKVTEFVINKSKGNTLKHITNVPSNATQKGQAELFAVKQIRKSRLAESQEGFPTYLLREFDLLLRVRHPNIVEARELVLLDPSPQLNLCHANKTHKVEGVSSSNKITSKKLLQEEQEVEENEKKREEQQQQKQKQNVNEKEHAKKEQENNEEEEQEEEDEKMKEPEGKNTDSSSNGPAVNTKLDKPKEAIAKTNPVQSSSTSSLPHSSTKVRDVFLIMEYCPFDLKRYMFYYARNANPQLPPTPFLHISSHNRHPYATYALISRIKCVMYQLLAGLRFLHDHRILHRDLKTSNILLDQHGRIKLCDFGLARHYREGQRLTPTVVTLLYRAPERHFGVVDYSHKLDSWSAGCIFAELFLKEPLFKAETDIGHLRSICDVMGIPSEETFPGLYKLPAAKEMMRGIGRWNRENKLAKIFATSTCRDAAEIPPSALDLLNKLLEWNPARRLSAKEALEHAFFTEFPPPCAPSELLTPMPTLYSSSNQTLVTQETWDTTMKSKDMPISASASVCVSANVKYDDISNISGNNNNNNNGNGNSETYNAQLHNSETYAHSKNSNLTKTYSIGNTDNNNLWQHKFESDKELLAPEGVNNEDETILESYRDEENDMYCSPVDNIRDNSSRTATNSMIVNSALYNTNNNNINNDYENLNSKSCDDDDNNANNNNDDDGDTSITKVTNETNMKSQWEREQQG